MDKDIKRLAAILQRARDRGDRAAELIVLGRLGKALSVPGWALEHLIDR